VTAPTGSAGPRELGQACREIAGPQLREAPIAVWGEVPDDPLVQPRVERGPAGWVLANLACQPDDVLVLGAGRQGALGRAGELRDAVGDAEAGSPGEDPSRSAT
jgi:hypothetical protein